MTDTKPTTGPATTLGDIILNLIVTLLAPMFLTAANGDLDFARSAALETINSYRARNHADLIAVAQIIGCGLAALGSLSLSMADDISLAMTLRLRGNANALIRTAELPRRTLREDPAPTAEQFDPDPQFGEAQVIASVKATQQRVAAVQQPNPQNHEPPPPAPAQPAPLLTPAQPITEQQCHAMWAASMAEVAAEYTAGLSNLPPRERKHASIRAAALSSTANALLSGTIPSTGPTAA
ncbi:MAG: hypothetical protein ABSC06_17820 [Rhodopila sp.]|jgi:hypothetical protein